MSFIKPAFGVVGSLLFGKKTTPKKNANDQSAAAPSRNAAAEIAARMDVLSRRRGGDATRITGNAGAEAVGVGGKTKLGM
jgi:hypothetical protein